MTTDRRLYDMDLGRRDHTRWLGSSGRYSTHGFAYSDIPNQLLRINSLEGSLAFSGAVLTGVTDVSPVAGTVNVTGSPVYTASNAQLNGAPSVHVNPGSSVIAPNVNRADAVFFAVVVGWAGGTTMTMFDGQSVAAGRVTASLRTDGIFTHRGLLSTVPPTGRNRMLMSADGSTATLLNGSVVGTLTAGVGSGLGLRLLSNYSGGATGIKLTFFMACSAVPSAPLLAALEAKLITDFG